MIILDDKDDREIPDSGHINSLMNASLIRRPIAKVAYDHIWLMIHLKRQRHTNRDDRAAPHDSRRADYTLFDAGHMHRAAFPLIVPCLLRVQFGHHFFYVHALAHHVCVATVCRLHKIARLKTSRNSNRYGFLPYL